IIVRQFTDSGWCARRSGTDDCRILCGSILWESSRGMFNMFEQHTVYAVVLTGGRSSRMGGRHKPGILIDGRSVIDRTLRALWSAAPSAQVVIAGSAGGLSPQLRDRVLVVREDPPFSGPLAGVAAARQAIPASDGVV